MNWRILVCWLLLWIAFPILFLVLLYPRILLIPYLCFFAFQCTQGKNNFILDFLRDVIDLKSCFRSWEVVYEEEFKTKKCLLVSQPHFLLSFTSAINYYSESRIRSFVPLTTRSALYFPIYGLFFRWFGGVSADPSNFKKLMAQGENLLLVPGGFEEATLTQFNRLRFFIHRKKGFIKYSLQYGYTLYPVIYFGEEKMYHMVKGFQSFRLLLNKLKFPGVFPKSLFPETNIDVKTIFGKGIELPHIPNPSLEEINLYHKLYIESLIGLYEKYKNKYGIKTELEFFDD